ncbi:hypothetical protein Pyn_22584 [Prunus yedoensis var. nudiflora]|uniref:Uncharacterized protein n=1 Tax=Prunus yedoensis var. nudiflora TaxID=2094558 RepID=A0A314ZMH4_PRUYE|nr:hypothetical protein Pyn_22584 [Prunus yedoensis var. nudiflora]
MAVAVEMGRKRRKTRAMVVAKRSIQRVSPGLDNFHMERYTVMDMVIKMGHSKRGRKCCYCAVRSLAY